MKISAPVYPRTLAETRLQSVYLQTRTYVRAAGSYIAEVNSRPFRSAELPPASGMLQPILKRHSQQATSCKPSSDGKAPCGAAATSDRTPIYTTCKSDHPLTTPHMCQCVRLRFQDCKGGADPAKLVHTRAHTRRLTHGVVYAAVRKSLALLKVNVRAVYTHC